MRLLSLIVVLLLVACGGEEAPVLIEGFAARSPEAACEPLEGPQPEPLSVAQLQPVTDSTFLLVDEGGRELMVLDADARRVSAFTLAERGPRGVAKLSDAALSGDSLLVVADGGLGRLRAFEPTGRDLWTLQLDFPPQRVAFANGRLLVAAAGMDARLPSLLYEVRAGRVEPLSVPLVRHADAITRLFVNSVTLQGYPDGSALLAHQFVEPRAWRVGSRGAPRAVVVPVPATTAASLGRLPGIPPTEEELAGMAMPVIASSPDPGTGGLLYLTRSGRRRHGRSEKAIVRVDADFAYVASRVLEVNAVQLAYLPAHPGSVIVVDYEDRWYRCEAP